MSVTGEGENWTTRIVRDRAFRDAELRRSIMLERAGSAIAALLAITAVWGHTAGDALVGGISAATIGGVSTLSFAAMMAITASGGVRKRVILLATEILKEAQGPPKA